MVTFAAPVGIAFTFVGFGMLMDWVDWPWAFAITGGITALLAVLWTLYGTNRPAEHRSVNAAELWLIEQDEPAWNRDKEPTPLEPARTVDPWHILLCNRSLVLLTVSYGAVNYFEYLFSFWLHHYFVEVLHLGKVESRYYAGFTYLAEAAGMVLGGWLSDWLWRRYGYRRGRAIVPVAGMLASALFLGLGLLATETVWIVGWFALAIGAAGMREGPFWATAIELVAPRGTLAAICNTGATRRTGGPGRYPLGQRAVRLAVRHRPRQSLRLACASLWWWIDPADRCTD